MRAERSTPTPAADETLSPFIEGDGSHCRTMKIETTVGRDLGRGAMLRDQRAPSPHRSRKRSSRERSPPTFRDRYRILQSSSNDRRLRDRIDDRSTDRQRYHASDRSRGRGSQRGNGSRYNDRNSLDRDYRQDRNRRRARDYASSEDTDSDLDFDDVSNYERPRSPDYRRYRR